MVKFADVLCIFIFLHLSIWGKCTFIDLIYDYVTFGLWLFSFREAIVI